MSYQEDLKAFLDGELSEERAQEVRLAIARDPELAKEADELTNLSTAFQQLPQPRPYGLEDTLIALARSPRREPKKLPWPTFLGLGLAGAGALVLAINLVNPSSQFRADQRSSESVAMASKAVPAPTIEDARTLERVIAKDEGKEAWSNRAKEPSAPRSSRLSAPSAAIKEVAKSKGAPVGRARSERDKSASAGAAAAIAAPPQPAQESPQFDNALAMAKKIDETVIEIQVSSIEEAAQLVKEAAVLHNTNLAVPEKLNDKDQSLALDVPVDQVDAFTKKVKEIPKDLETRLQARFANNRQQNQASPNNQQTFGQGQSQGGGFGGGGFGGGGLGGPGGGQGAAGAQGKSRVEESRDSKPVPRKKVRVRLIIAKPKEDQP